MANPMIAVAGATVASSAIGSRSASRAARAQSRASREGIAAQQEALAAQQAFTDPFRQVGLAAAPQLLQTLGIQVPESLLAEIPNTQQFREREIADLESRIASIDSNIAERRLLESEAPPRRIGPPRGDRTPIRSTEDLERAISPIDTRNAALSQERDLLQSRLDELRALPEIEQQAATQQPSFLEQVDPLVSFLRQEGFEDIQESAAAQGRLRSGGTLEDLTRFSENLASTVAPQLQQQRFNQLFNLLGLGANVAAGQGTAQLQTASNIGNLLGNIGQAQAGAAIGQGQAIQQGISGLTGLLGAQQAGVFSGNQAAVNPNQNVLLGSEAVQGARGTQLGGF